MQVTCDECEAIIVSKPITPPKDDQDLEFWKEYPQYWEDLPAGADCSDEEGLYRSEFTEQFKTDTANELDVIIDEYWAASKEKRIIMNWVFVRLCGYTLPALVRKAHGQESNDEEAHQPNEAR